MKPIVLALVLAAAFVAVACGPGAAAEAVRPRSLTGAEAMGEKRCFVPENDGSPLVVDWKADERSDLEVAMRDGIAVVAYTCDTIKLLRDCHIDGRYGFKGVTRKEDVIQLKNEDELRANLPKTGALVGTDIRADLARGASIDVAVMLVGKRRTTRIHATRADLVGECDGATHLVRGASVGAFAMTSGSRAEIRTVAQIFGGGGDAASGSAHVQQSRDGTLESCASANPDDDAPPKQCGATIRLELAAISEHAPAPGSGTRDDASGECASGLVLSSGKCTRPDAEPTHQCAEKDLVDCATQCERGHLGSCSILAVATLYGRGVTKDEARAIELFDRACNAGIGRGCTGLGVAYAKGLGVRQDAARAADLFKRACDTGYARGCKNLGVAYADGTGVPKDEARGARLIGQSCDAGSPEGCYDFALLYANGRGVPQDDHRAADLYKQSCDADYALACSSLALALETGSGVTKDAKRAAALYQKSCDAGDATGCASATRLGVPAH
jgi:hypothetical protein